MSRSRFTLADVSKKSPSIQAQVAAALMKDVTFPILTEDAVHIYEITPRRKRSKVLNPIPGAIAKCIVQDVPDGATRGEATYTGRVRIRG